MGENIFKKLSNKITGKSEMPELDRETLRETVRKLQDLEKKNPNIAEVFKKDLVTGVKAKILILDHYVDEEITKRKSLKEDKKKEKKRELEHGIDSFIKNVSLLDAIVSKEELELLNSRLELLKLRNDSGLTIEEMKKQSAKAAEMDEMMKKAVDEMIQDYNQHSK